MPEPLLRFVRQNSDNCLQKCAKITVTDIGKRDVVFNTANEKVVDFGHSTGYLSFRRIQTYLKRVRLKCT